MKNKSDKMELIELKRGAPLEDILRDMIERGMSWDAIADDLGVTRLTLESWRDFLGLKVARTLVSSGSTSP